MTRYRKKPVEVDAFQWFKNGDHPDDYNVPDFTDPVSGEVITGEQRRERGWEGHVVRYYRHPDVPGTTVHGALSDPPINCGYTMHEHGWTDTLEGGHNVCPGDFIITGVAGERYPCKPDIFAATYEPAHADLRDCWGGRWIYDDSEGKYAPDDGEGEWLTRADLEAQNGPITVIAE